MVIGAYLDCSRNAVMKPCELKKLIDILSALGYKELYLYMEDTYELPSEPYFGRFRSKYTEEDLRELDDYCFERGMELIPGIQVLGHMGTAYRWWKYQEMFDTEDILLVGEEKTYAFLDKAFGYFRSVLRTDKIHVGMDEAYSVGRGKYLDKNGYNQPYNILSEHLSKISKLLEKHQFKGLMWSDMFFHFANEGKYEAKGLDEKRFAEAVAKLPHNIEVVYWEYYSRDEKRYDDMLGLHKQYFQKTSFAGGACCWQGFAPHNELSLGVSKIALKSCAKQQTDRAILTLWGDGGGQASFYSVLPCIVAWAEYANGNFDDARIKERFAELVGESFDRFTLLDIPNRIAEERISPENRNDVNPLNPSLYMLYSDYFSGAFDCYVQEGDGEIYAEYADKLLSNAVGRYGYIFETLGRLCKVLELKYDLGVKTRRLYQARDKDGLQKLIDKEYSLLPSRIESFLSAYWKLWSKENKSCGVEVEDVRLGGLIQRTKHCKVLLQAFIDNDEEIVELNEPTLDYFGEEKGNTPILCNKYISCATGNVLSHELIYRGVVLG